MTTMARTRRRGGVRQEEGESQWVSFTDIMSGLLLVFILATVALMLQVATRDAELKSSQEAFEAKVAEAKLNNTFSMRRSARSAKQKS